MVTIDGKGVFGGVAYGKISFYKHRKVEVTEKKIEDIQKELARFENAKQISVNQLSYLLKKASNEVSEDSAQIFEVHRMMLEDGDYCDAITDMVKTQKVNAEYAIAVTAERFAKMFADMEDDYMKAREADVRDISGRLLQNLCAEKKEDCHEGTEAAGSNEAVENVGMTDKVIICADDLSPSETVLLEKDKVLAFVTKYGSNNSHTAILARAMNIPALIGCGEALLEAYDGLLAAVDGFDGKLYVEPDTDTLKMIEQKREEGERRNRLLQELKGKENVTLDGKKIDIFANIAEVEEVQTAIAQDAGGIGLFRSEFLYLESKDFPDEQKQFVAYKTVLERMADKRVVIRTMDIGADKQIEYFGLEKEENPALGYRAIRICLTRQDIFKTQIRALLRASVFGKLAIMFPMITAVEEVKQIREIVEQVKRELAVEGHAVSEQIEFGIMIETPAAAIISDLLAPEVDFFSVGTNDLTQYTLAVDRQNPKLDAFCNPHHEAVLRLIEMAARAAHENGKWIGICGELAADEALTEYWLKIGIDELSVSPAFILPLRKKVRETNLRK